MLERNTRQRSHLARDAEDRQAVGAVRGELEREDVVVEAERDARVCARGALQLDLTYPLRALSSKNVDLYLDAQLFTGYGESLLEYDQSETNFRIGVALVR